MKSSLPSLSFGGGVVKTGGFISCIDGDGASTCFSDGTGDISGWKTGVGACFGSSVGVGAGVEMNTGDCFDSDGASTVSEFGVGTCVGAMSSSISDEGVGAFTIGDIAGGWGIVGFGGGEKAGGGGG